MPTWRDRLPEIVAAIGLAFVAAAMAGFLSSSWDALDDAAKALLLAALSAGLTAAAAWSDRASRPALQRLGHAVWAAGSVTLAAAITLLLQEALPDSNRFVYAFAGLGAAAHAGLRLRSHRDAVTPFAALAGSLLYAAGPPGTMLADVFDSEVWRALGDPINGLFDTGHQTDAFLLTGPAHLLAGAGFLAAARLLQGRAAVVAKLTGTVTLWFAAAELNVLTVEVGAVVALLVVLGHLVHGLLVDDGLLVALGTVATLLAGIRVLTALFSGEVAVTLTVLGAGVAMLAWAYRAAASRDDAAPEDPTRAPDA